MKLNYSFIALLGLLSYSQSSFASNTSPSITITDISNGNTYTENNVSQSSRINTPPMEAYDEANPYGKFQPKPQGTISSSPKNDDEENPYEKFSPKQLNSISKSASPTASSSTPTPTKRHKKPLSDINPRMRESSFFKELTSDLSPEEEAMIKRNEERAKKRSFSILTSAARNGDAKAILAIKLKSFEESELGKDAIKTLKSIGKAKVKSAMKEIVKSQENTDIDLVIRLANKDPELKKILLQRIIELDSSLSDDSRIKDVTKTLEKYPLDLIREAIELKTQQENSSPSLLNRIKNFFSSIRG